MSEELTAAAKDVIRAWKKWKVSRYTTPPELPTVGHLDEVVYALALALTRLPNSIIPEGTRFLGELRPGAVYALRTTVDELTLDVKKALSEELDKASKYAGVKFVLIAPGIEFVEPKEVAP